MNEQTSIKVVVPREMTPDEKQILVDELYALRRRIFEGSRRKRSFASHVVEAGAEHGAVVLHRGAGGQLVGYFAMEILERASSGATIAIFRGESGALGGRSGGDGALRLVGDIVLRLVLERLIRYMLAHPGRPMVCLCSLAHPSSYALFARFVDITHTSPVAGADALMSGLAGSFDLEPSEHGGPFVFEAGRADEPADDCGFLHLYENPSVRCFVSAHPGPAEGRGLVTLVPLSLGGMVRAAARYAGPASKRW
ncbi:MULTISPECIES: hypothetical protein [Sorangium]|uniref:Uncharacterized protein n=1 Tax=Sorangium cellulosum TaxID=56 RepID=A0A4P2R573_SORCE|nr:MULTISPECIES: hypothetical protein [Sorangium]AUX38254.1 hypothetical protein SOCE836_104950 [Sorangium cellulosum]WCQ97543.1 hypothetical protein NQZ70_10337 [Sorangium sp. Soce836]